MLVHNFKYCLVDNVVICIYTYKFIIPKKTGECQADNLYEIERRKKNEFQINQLEIGQRKLQETKKDNINLHRLVKVFV